MRLICIILVSLGFTVSIYAQDTIIFRNGDEIKAYVKEVSNRELKYQLFCDPDGPIYIKSITDIFMVKYTDGRKELFSNKATLPSNNGDDDKNCDYMDISHGKLLLKGMLLNENEIKEIFEDETYNNFTSALSQWQKGGKIVSFGIMGTVGGAMLLLLSDGIEGTLSSVFLYTGIGIVCFCQIEMVRGFILKGIGNGRIHGIIDNYNAAHGYSDNFSVRFAPSLLRTTTAPGSSTFGVGAGLTLNF